MRRVAILLLAIVVIDACPPRVKPKLPTLATSCVGRCGENDYINGSCECNTVCQDNGYCCSDHQAVCFTCQDRCGDPFVESAPCHCNNECGQHGNCCGDYPNLCDVGSVSLVPDEDLLKLSKQLMDLDNNNVAQHVTINKQVLAKDQPKDYVTPYPLFTTVPPLTGATFAAFEALRVNSYIPLVSVTEVITPEFINKKNKFLDEVMKTPVMDKLKDFLGMDKEKFRKTIDEIWFTLYPRDDKRKVLGSSGFEHVFIGEVDKRQKSVTGFHNWVSFYREELADRRVKYKGYLEPYADFGVKGHMLAARFTWKPPGDIYTKDAKKLVSSFFIGTSPEFDLAVYTLCFFTRPKGKCILQATNNVKYCIETNEIKYGSPEQTLVYHASTGCTFT